MKKIYYSYDEFKDDLKKLLPLIKNENFDAILGVARGGLSISHMLAESLNLRACFSINSIHYEDTKKLNSIKIFNIPDLNEYKKVLIVDDIVDSGDTMVGILKVLREKYPNVKFKIASIFYKKIAQIKPDFYIKESEDWIEFFWSCDLK